MTATPMGLTDKNLFAYCDNNPVIRADHGGEFWHLVVGGIIGGVIGGVTSALTGGSASEIIISTIAGAAGGVLTASGVGLLGQVVGGAAISMASNSATQITKIVTKKQNSFDVGIFLLDGAVGAVCGLISGSGASSVAQGTGGQDQMVQLGVNTVKRTWNELTHNGLHAFGREATKAANYYLKSTVKNTVALFSKRNLYAMTTNVTYNIVKAGIK